MPRIAIGQALLPRRTVDHMRALVERMSSCLSVVVDREIVLSIESYEFLTPPLEHAAGQWVGFEFAADGAAEGRCLTLIEVRSAVTLLGILCMMNPSQIESRRADAALIPEDAGSIREIGNILRGAAEETIRDRTAVHLRFSEAGADELSSLVGERGSTWPQSLCLRCTLAVEGFETGPAEILITERLAHALDPALVLDPAARRISSTDTSVDPNSVEPDPLLPTVIVFERDAFYQELIVATLGSNVRIVTAPAVRKLRDLLRASPRAALVVAVAEDDIETVREIAALRGQPNAPEILATVAQAKRSLVVRLARAGVTRILPKPYSLLALRRQLEALLVARQK
jgi:CheY-like chemotaxis protein